MLLGIAYPGLLLVVVVNVVIVIISVPMITDLANVTAPPPGQAWLEQILLSLFPVSAAAIYGFAWPAIAGALLGLVGVSWPWRWVTWTWPYAQALAGRAAGLLQRKPVAMGAAVLGGLAVLAVIHHPLVLALVSAAVTLLLIRHRGAGRLARPGLAAACGVSLAGLLGLALRGPYQLPLDAAWLRLVYALLVGPALGVMLASLAAYAPALRPVVLLGAALLVGLAGHFSQGELVLTGGVSSYDGQQFEEMAGWPKGTGVTVFFEDEASVWAGTPGAGVLRFDGSAWAPLATDVPHVAVFARDTSSVVWIDGQEGLLRYNRATGRRDAFDASNSGLAVDWVRDVVVD